MDVITVTAVTALPSSQQERQSHPKHKATAGVTHLLGEICKTQQLPQRVRFQMGWNKDCQGN